MKRVKANIQIPQDILTIQELFTKNGKKLFVVGGAVRDFLLGKIPSDFDLVTDAVPSEVIEILHGYNTDLQGEHFAVVRVFTDDEPDGHEIASFRKDISHGRDTKGDDKKVETGQHITIEDDVNRRDISINSLFFDIDKKEIVDLVGGIDDLNNGIIRAVGNASDRFKEDRLRILRCVRFSASLNFDLQVDTFDAILDDNRLFGVSEKDDVSKERIIAEIIKMEQKANGDGNKLKNFFTLLYHTGILVQIFPNIILNNFLEKSDNLIIILSQLFLYCDLNDTLVNVLKNAKLSNKMISQILCLLSFRFGIITDLVVTLKKNQLKSHVADIMLMEWFNILKQDIIKLDKYIDFKLTVSGNDVMADGFKGKEIADEICRREKINFEQFNKNNIL